MDMNEELKPGDLGYRRRRNIQLASGRNNNFNNSTGINWAKPKVPLDLENNYDIEYEDEIYDQKDELESNECDIGIKVSTEKNSVVNIEEMKAKFQSAETEKITIYLDKYIIDILKVLKKEKRISSYSQCVKYALLKYLNIS
jgi:hypothetical protein